MTNGLYLDKKKCFQHYPYILLHQKKNIYFYLSVGLILDRRVLKWIESEGYILDFFWNFFFFFKIKT